MIKPDTCVYLIPLHPVFNENDVPLFDSFDKQNSVNLYSALMLNYFEILNSISPYLSVLYCFDEKDSEYIPVELKITGAPYFLSNTSSKAELLKSLSEKYFNKYNNNLVIFTSSISVSPDDILKFVNLLNRDDETFIIGNAHNGKVSYLGFNNYNRELFSQIDYTGLDFNNMLKLVCKYDLYLNVLNGSLFVNSVDDFKILYKELSKKESFSYCSQKMHEKFTHLFIEYKEMLK